MGSMGERRRSVDPERRKLNSNLVHQLEDAPASLALALALSLSRSLALALTIQAGHRESPGTSAAARRTMPRRV